MKTNDLLTQIGRIADALERLAPLKSKPAQFQAGKAYLWQGEAQSFAFIDKVNAIDLKFPIGIGLQQKKLMTNTSSFAKGYPANNALLWGARGMGKSSLVKAVHQQLMKENPDWPRILIEILREAISTLTACLDQIKQDKHRFILFCDDLSFDQKDNSYKSLKALLEGGLAGRPDNVIFYATSNQRHLLNRDQSEYHTSTAIHGSDITNETISLSDRFGLWLGFHNCSPQEFQEMIETYAAHYQIPLNEDNLLKQAHQWQMERGSRSGRVAWQFIQHLLGVHEIK